MTESDSATGERSGPIMVDVPQRRAMWLSSGALTLVLLIGLPAITAAQEPSGLQAAAALEKLLEDSIARSEKSVVAIARVRKPDDADANLISPLSRPFPRQDPTDPDFIPNDFGAGVVIDPAGLILTTHHVIGDPKLSEVYVWSERRPFKAAVIAADPWSDLAVLKVEASGLAPIPFSDGKQLKKGQIVIALGNPHAIARDGEVSASWGIISNVLRRAPRTGEPADGSGRPDTLHHYGTLIQTDAKLNLGFSGGALINLRGEMIGLTVSYAAAAGYETAAGFAIPVDANFRRAVDSLKQGRKPEFGFLGVAPESISRELRQTGIHGAQITRVLAATPAARAELRTGDVISHINGDAVYDDDDLIRLVGSLAPETTAEFTIVRGDFERGQTRILTKQVLLSKKFVTALRPQYGTAAEPDWRGVQVDFATAVPNFEAIAHRLDPAGCVHLERVVRDSPGWLAGLRPGMLVSHVQRSRVATPAEFYAAVEGKPGALRLRVISNQGTAAVLTVSP